VIAVVNSSMRKTSLAEKVAQQIRQFTKHTWLSYDSYAEIVKVGSWPKAGTTAPSQCTPVTTIDRSNKPGLFRLSPAT
jgi:hypothetical protein